MSPTDYKFSVKTSDKAFAGTDATVFLQLFGKGGVSQVFELKKSQHVNKFERGHLDEFIFTNVRGIGEVDQVKVWQDNKGTMPSWHLEFIEVHDANVGKKMRFLCNKWIGGSEDAEATLRRLE